MCVVCVQAKIDLQHPMKRIGGGGVPPPLQLPVVCFPVITCQQSAVQVVIMVFFAAVRGAEY